MAKKYFTEAKAREFIAKQSSRIPSIELRPARVPNGQQGDQWYIALWQGLRCIAFVNNSVEFEQLIMFCFSVVGDLQPIDYDADEPIPYELVQRDAVE